ncbi:envelope stress response membrane protein PspC [Dyella jejuensis]|uniref:Envelope stress response membrane protein PspC n=1 Tax=Dyella jejuensis TaxID=1432009 RepID=A0ABW8JLG8_9GAMM
MRRNRNWRAQCFYRDTQRGKLMGVCAALADYLDCNVTIVRILAIIVLLWTNGLIVIAYLILGFMLPTKPDMLYAWDADEEYWRSTRRSAGDTFRDTRHRFREPDMKPQHMKGYVTSSRYDLDRQFRDLEH